jgi:phage terminase small subunit
MTKARKNFVNYYIEQDFKNAAAAYQRAYPQASEESARREASRLLTNVDIQEYMGTVIAGVLRRDKIPLEKRILDTWLKRAFYDPAEIVDGKGALLCPLEELSRQGLSICVEGIENRINAQGVEIIKVKLADRDKALEMLQQYIQMVKPQKQEIEINTISDEARRRLEVIFNAGKEPLVVLPKIIAKRNQGKSGDEGL